MSEINKIEATADLAFRQAIGGGYPAARSLVLSLFVHGLGVTAALLVFGVSSNPPEQRSESTPPNAIRIDHRLFLVSRITTTRRLTKPSPIRATVAPKPLAETKQQEALASPAPKPFVPPELKKKPVSEATLLQPLLPPDVAQVVPPLPSFRVSTSQLHAAKVLKAFVAPGRPSPAAPAQTPRLAAPAIEITQAAVGDPMNILSLNDHPVVLTDKIVVPAINVAGKMGDGTSSVFGKSDRGLSGLAGTGASGAIAVMAANAAGAGDFDAVVVQSSNLDQFPETKTLLPGRPIYTVYISTGSPKEWALYFCLRGAKTPAAGSQHVVTLDSVPPIQAPYPTHLVRPGVTPPAYYKYILVHGVVNSGGRFENLRVVRPSKPEADQAVLASLAGWEFRPATEDGVKVAVEFVLSIPVSGL